MAEMSRWERVRAALAGREVDRVPVVFWGHDYEREGTPDGLAEATLERYRRFGWDLIKVNPRATYYMEAWGNKYAPGDASHRPGMTKYVLHSAADFERVSVVDVSEGPFAEQIEALQLIAAGLEGEAPFIQTVFSPLTVIGRLAGGDLSRVRRHMREDRETLHAALSAVADTLAAYAGACVEAGASGIFFATVDWGTYDVATFEQYAEFGQPYDLKVLAGAAAAEMNVLHVCRRHNMLEALIDYPVKVLNWAAEQTGNQPLGEILAVSDKTVMGGVAVDTMSDGTVEQVKGEVEAALRETGRQRFILSAGCSIPPHTPEENLRACLDVVERRAGES